MTNTDGGNSFFSMEMPDIQGLIEQLDLMNEYVNQELRDGLHEGAEIICKEQKRLAELGALIDVSQLERLKLELITAISDSMPKSQSNDMQEENPLAELQLRAFYCDIMGRPESELFSSTYKEINDRTENYLIAKGLKKPPQIVQMLDD